MARGGYIEVELCEYVRVHFSEMETEDLIDAINDHYKSGSKKEKQNIISRLDFTVPSNAGPDASLLETLKMEIVGKGIAKKSIEELEEFFK